jgi:phosphodiesterase/alkaline phosphatase D-like protein
MSPSEQFRPGPGPGGYAPRPRRSRGAAPVGQAQFGGAVSAISAGSTTSVTCAMPAGLAVGDLLIAAHAIGSSSDTVTFAGGTGGWTVNRFTGATGVGDSFAWKIAGASEPSLIVTSGSNRNHGLIVARYSGADVANPIVNFANAGQVTTTNTHTAPGVAASGDILEVVLMMDHPPGSGGGNTNWTEPAALIERGEAKPTPNGFQGTSVGLADAGIVTSTGATPSRDCVSTLSALGSAWSVAIRSAGGPPVPITPTVSPRVVGVDRVRVDTNDAISVRLKIGTDAAVTTGVVFTSAQTPDGQGKTSHTWAGLGLADGTRYYYRVAMTDTGSNEILDNLIVGQIHTAPVGQTNFAFNAASCCNANDSNSMGAIATRNDDLFIHLGDLWYADGTGVNLNNYRTQMGNKLAVSNHAAVFSTTATTFTPSDHDFGMVNNGYGTDGTGSLALYNQVYREMLPVVTVEPTTGIHHTFVWGRVRFIIMDCRSFMVNPSNTDNSSKTKLGTVQKQWVKDTITAATEALICLVGDVPWTGTAQAGDDAWDGYTTERTELDNFFDASGKNFMYIAGDMHAVAADDGTNGLGMQVFQAAPLNNAASIKAEPYTAGPYPASGSATVQQYGRFVVTDTGSSIQIDFTGYSSDNTVRVTQTSTWTVGSGATGTLATTLDDSVLAATGSETFTGTLATTLDDSVLAASGTVANPVTGTLAVTLADDALAASGAETFTGTFATTLDDSTLAASGTVANPVTGTLATTLDDAVLAASGTSGAAGITGTLAVTLDDAVLAASGNETITGTLATTLDDAALASSGTVANPVTGTLASTLDDSVLAAAGNETISGPFATTLADVVLAATGAETISGTLATTLDDAALAVSGTVAIPVTGTLATTLDGGTLAAVGTAGPADVTGILATTLGDATLASNGTETISGTAAATLGDDTLAAAGTVANPVTGTIAAALADVTVSSFGTETISGPLTTTLDGATLAALGGIPVTGTLVITLEDALLAATGIGFVVPPTHHPRGRIHETSADATIRPTYARAEVEQ